MDGSGPSHDLYRFVYREDDEEEREEFIAIYTDYRDLIERADPIIRVVPDVLSWERVHGMCSGEVVLYLPESGYSNRVKRGMAKLARKIRYSELEDLPNGVGSLLRNASHLVQNQRELIRHCPAVAEYAPAPNEKAIVECVLYHIAQCLIK